MQNISSISPFHFVAPDDNKFSEVFKFDVDGEVTRTGVIMAVEQTTLNGAPWRLESVDFPTAFKALDKIRAMFPNWDVRVKDQTVVASKTIGLPAIGTANTNLFIVVGNALALAPAWVLLGKDATESSIRSMAEKIGVLGAIEDYRPGIPQRVNF